MVRDFSKEARIVVGIVLIAASFLAFGLSTYTSVRMRQYVDCQATWSQAYAASAQERAIAAEQDREALDKMIVGFANAQSGQAARDAIAAYLDARATADEIRATNPVPELPDDVCK